MTLRMQPPQGGTRVDQRKRIRMHIRTQLTFAVNVKIDNGRIESLMERIADKKRRQNGRAPKTQAGRRVLAEPARVK